jgi:putative transposase
MSKVADVRVVERENAVDLPEVSDELRVALTDIAATAREGLLAMSVAVGLQVMAELMGDVITATVGLKHARLAHPTAVRHASTAGSVVLGGRKVAVRRPRARTLDGHEVQLASYAAFAADDQLEQVVFERMLAGLATRRHRAAAEPVGQAVEQALRRRRSRRCPAASCVAPPVSSSG